MSSFPPPFSIFCGTIFYWLHKATDVVGGDFVRVSISGRKQKTLGLFGKLATTKTDEQSYINLPNRFCPKEIKI